MRPQIIRSLFAAAALATPLPSHAVEPVATAFSYQAYVQLEGAALDEPADFRFTLWDGPDLPAVQLGDEVVVRDRDVANGLVSVELDFGLGAFAAAEARWLQVEVAVPPGSDDFVALTPRRALTPTPFALHALSGTAGPQGVQGDPGPPGDTGPPGDAGPRGDTGPPGERGPQGEQGLPGEDGDTPWKLDVRTAYYDRGRVGIGGTRGTSGAAGEQLTVHGPSVTWGGINVNVDGDGFEKPYVGYAVNGTQVYYTYYDAEDREWRIRNRQDETSLSISRDAQADVVQVGIGRDAPRSMLHVGGDARVDSLAGTGVRSVKVDPDGVLTAADPTRFHAIPAAAFTPESSQSTFTKVDGLARLHSVGGGAMSAAVNLPHGARVTGVDLYYIDDSAAETMTMRLESRPFTGGDASTMAEIVSADGPPSVQSASATAIGTPQVDNESNVYRVRITADNWSAGPLLLGVSGVRITYEAP